VDSQTNQTVAHLCFNCESKLEKLRAEYSVDSIGDCFVCGEDAQYLLPALTSALNTDDLTARPNFKRNISQETPWLCHTHLEALAEKSLSASTK
jgi:hypothetical protein